MARAYNGLELLDKIGELHPNTVITDLSMPGMTGLELIEQAQADYPDVNFIVMSGYTDFEYVQKALRFGVWDYLLKPLQKSELNAILKKLDEHLDTLHFRELRQETMRSELERSLGVLQERYLEDVWQSGKAVSVPSIGEKPILEFEGGTMQSLLFCVDWQFGILGMDDTALKRQAGSLLSHMFDGLSAGAEEPRLCAFSSDVYEVVLVLYPGDRAHLETELLQRAGRLLRTFNSQNNHARISCAASALLPGRWEDLPEAFAQARAALQWRLEEKSGGVIVYQPAAALALQKVYPFTQEASLRQAVEAADEQQVLKCLLADWTRQQHPVPGSSYRLMEEQLRCINQALLQLPGADRLWSGPQVHPLWVLSGGGFAPTEFPGRIADGVRRALAEYRAFFISRENGVVAQAKQYVAQHFAEDISLNQIAKQVCLSPAYFSTLFKAETGCSFIKYLQRVRMEHAKKMLKSTKIRISDIAQAVGYHDLKFFNKVFLTETTVTPSEYRKYYS